MSSAKKREVLRQAHIHEQQLFITEDDHRNNDHFLKLHPNTVVRGKRGSKHKTPNQLNSVELHSTDTKTIFAKSSYSDIKIKERNVEDLQKNSVYVDLQRAEALNNPTATNPEAYFAMHEIIDEDYDPDLDYKLYGHLDYAPVVDGSIPEFVPVFAPPETINIDQTSYMLQTDAQDGSVTFKVSVNFDSDSDMSDYDIIVTQVTAA